MIEPLIEHLRDNYIAAQLRGNRREALRLIMEDALGNGMSASQIYLQIIAPAQREIGRRWQVNEITVAQEHLATAISQVAISNLYSHLDRTASNGRCIIVACAEGEHHELGARMAADFLEVAGFTVLFLGADVPAEDVAKMATLHGAGMVVLSCATSLCWPGIRKSIEHLHEALGRDFPIAVGGHAFARDDRSETFGVLDAGETAEDLVRTAHRVMDIAKVAA